MRSKLYYNITITKTFITDNRVTMPGWYLEISEQVMPMNLPPMCIRYGPIEQGLLDAAAQDIIENAERRIQSTILMMSN